MLKVTTAALDRLSQKLDNKKAADEAALRFTRKPGGWRLQIDDPRPADKAFTHEGKKVLVMDGEVSQAMANMTLDVEKTGGGPRLRLLSDPGSES